MSLTPNQNLLLTVIIVLVFPGKSSPKSLNQLNGNASPPHEALIF